MKYEFYDLNSSILVTVCYSKAGVSNLLTKCAKILAKNLEWAIIVQIFCDVLCGFRPGPGLFVQKSRCANQNVQLCNKMHECSRLDRPALRHPFLDVRNLTLPLFYRAF